MPHLLIVNAFTSVQGIPIHLPVFIFCADKKGLGMPPELCCVIFSDLVACQEDHQYARIALPVFSVRVASDLVEGLYLK